MSLAFQQTCPFMIDPCPFERFVPCIAYLFYVHVRCLHYHSIGVVPFKTHIFVYSNSLF